MLIKELKLTKVLQGDAINPYEGESSDLKNILKQNGWEILGQGQEALVAEHPNKSYVLKLFYTNSKYVNFVEHVKDNQSNPHYPKFSRYIKNVPGTEYSYVRMEKLSKTNASEIMNDHFPELCALYMEGKKRELQSLGSDLWLSYIPDKIKELYDVNLRPKDGKPPSFPEDINKTMKDITKNVDRSWFEVCHDIVDLAKELRLKWLDLRDENFMKRGSTLIVADPFYD